MKHKSKIKKKLGIKKKPKTIKKERKKVREKGEETAIVFGYPISPKKIQDAASDAIRRREYTTDDIHLQDYIEKENENLMIKIVLLDHVEEKIRQKHPNLNVERKNKLTIKVR